MKRGERREGQREESGQRQEKEAARPRSGAIDSWVQVGWAGGNSKNECVYTVAHTPTCTYTTLTPHTLYCTYPSAHLSAYIYHHASPLSKHMRIFMHTPSLHIIQYHSRNTLHIHTHHPHTTHITYTHHTTNIRVTARSTDLTGIHTTSDLCSAATLLYLLSLNPKGGRREKPYSVYPSMKKEFSVFTAWWLVQSRCSIHKSGTASWLLSLTLGYWAKATPCCVYWPPMLFNPGGL